MCSECATPLEAGSRSDRITCSTNCRIKRRYRLDKERAIEEALMEYQGPNNG